MLSIQLSHECLDSAKSDMPMRIRLHRIGVGHLRVIHSYQKGSGSFKISSTMSHIPITNLFSVCDLQVNPYEEDKIRAQDVVNYFEARFRVALQATIKRSEVDQRWLYNLFIRELVCLSGEGHLFILNLNFSNCV